MVARWWGYDRVPPRGEPREQEAGDHQGPPGAAPPLSPLQMVMGLFFRRGSTFIPPARYALHNRPTRCVLHPGTMPPLPLLHNDHDT